MRQRSLAAAYAAVGLSLVLTPLSAAAQHANSEQLCSHLQNLIIPAKNIGLPTKGATIKGARLVPAAPERKQEATPANPSGITLARPEYCEVTGEIAPVDSVAPPIRFQVNLPTPWNGKALHMGGGGFDGVLQTGLGALSRAPNTTAYPITRGYVTFGSDGGHEGNDASFAGNEEALINFAYGHLKKTHDVALELIKVRYHQKPTHTYFAGQSGGGRQGLTVAQRFPADYDGVVVTAPAINYTNLMMRFTDVATGLARPGGFLTPAKVKAFGNSVLAQCDMNDGVADGIIGNYLGCHYDASVLRCADGADAGDSCLSDAQLKTIATIYGPTSWKDSTGKEIMFYPRFLLGGGEAAPSNMPVWIVGKAPMPHPQPPGKAMNQQQTGVGIASFYGNSAVRYLIVKDAAFDTFEFDPRPYANQVVAATKLLLSNDPNLGRFQKRGGKLIMLHNTADLAVSPIATIDYYNAIVKALGKETVDRFVRLYIVPGGDHGGSNAPSKVDLLGMLDNWVVDGRAPGSDAIAAEYGADMKITRSKPLCMYPYYPQYSGAGDPKTASSYRCTEGSKHTSEEAFRRRDR